MFAIVNNRQQKLFNLFFLNGFIVDTSTVEPQDRTCVRKSFTKSSRYLDKSNGGIAFNFN